MRTEQLQYLMDILKTGSINKTAQHFFISQQAVSNSLKQLENELGCTLLNRTATRRITEQPRPLGSRICPHSHGGLLAAFRAAGPNGQRSFG